METKSRAAARRGGRSGARSAGARDGKEAEARTHRDVLRAVRRIEIATRQAVNAELAGRYHSVFKGQGMAFSEVRPYTPGDDIRHIDWNVTARHEGLFVKQFIEERELTVMLLVDMSGSGEFGTRGKSKRRLLAEVGALVAFSAIKNNDRVGLLLFTDEVELYLAPRKGRHHVLRVIREIVEAEPKGSRTDIGAALAFLSRVMKRRAVCFLLSDFLDGSAAPPHRATQGSRTAASRDDARGPAWIQPMKVAMARHDVVAMRVSDPAELELPDLGIVELADAETGEAVLIDSSSPAVRSAFRSRQAERQAAVRRRLAQLGCDLVDLATDRDYVAPLVNFMRTRTRRMRAGR